CCRDCIGRGELAKQSWRTVGVRRCFAVIGFLQPPAVAVLVEERYGQSLRRALLLLESESMFPRVLCRGGTLRNWPFSDEEPVPIPALFFVRFVPSFFLVLLLNGVWRLRARCSRGAAADHSCAMVAIGADSSMALSRLWTKPGRPYSPKGAAIMK